LHDLARSIVDEDEQRFAALFEPAVLAAINLDQLAVRLTPKTGLMEGAALLRIELTISGLVRHNDPAK
jgi:hypothetical protein